MAMMQIIAVIAVVTVAAIAGCGPGPLPQVPHSPDQRDLNYVRDGFPTNSDDPFPLDTAIRSDRIDELRRLLENGENPNLRWGRSGDHFPLQEVLDTGGDRVSDPAESVRLLLAH